MLRKTLFCRLEKTAKMQRTQSTQTFLVKTNEVHTVLVQEQETNTTTRAILHKTFFFKSKEDAAYAFHLAQKRMVPLCVIKSPKHKYSHWLDIGMDELHFVGDPVPVNPEFAKNLVKLNSVMLNSSAPYAVTFESNYLSRSATSKREADLLEFVSLAQFVKDVGAANFLIFHRIINESCLVKLPRV